MDDRDLKLERFVVAIFVSSLMWIGVLIALHVFFEYRSCEADRELVR